MARDAEDRCGHAAVGEERRRFTGDARNAVVEGDRHRSGRESSRVQPVDESERSRRSHLRRAACRVRREDGRVECNGPSPGSIAWYVRARRRDGVIQQLRGPAPHAAADRRSAAGQGDTMHIRIAFARRERTRATGAAPSRSLCTERVAGTRCGKEGETSDRDLNNIRCVSRVTVIVPATNEPPTLGDCLRAIEGCDDPPEEVSSSASRRTRARRRTQPRSRERQGRSARVRRRRRRRARGRDRRIQSSSPPTRTSPPSSGSNTMRRRDEPRVVVPQPASSPRPPGLGRRCLDLLGGLGACGRGVSRVGGYDERAARPEHRGHRAGVESHGVREGGSSSTRRSSGRI